MPKMARALVVLAALVAVAAGASRSVTFNHRSAIIDGKPTLMLSGAVHYARVAPSDWDRVFTLAKEMNLNTIQTYVMWNVHEKIKGDLRWDGWADLNGFLKAAQSHGLFVTLRIGPYVCGEWYFGGIPIWMRNESNVSCFRCNDPVWEREMARFVGEVVQKVEPLLYPNGGPVVMLQIENEYGPFNDYLIWSVDMARNLTTAVPWNLCHDVDSCTKVNNGTDKALCTINGFWEEVLPPSDPHQPSQGWIAAQRKGNPNQPLIWTEDQGWFDQWGVAQRVRYSSDQMYGIARFIAYGGSWHNFYMLTGGNNYGLMSGGDVVTAYAPDTVIDYLLLPHQPRYDFYKKFFGTMQQIESDLLSNDVPQPVPLHPSSSSSAAAASSSMDANDVDRTLQFMQCYQYDQPEQVWTYTGTPDGEAGTISPEVAPTLCVSADSANPVKLVACKTSDEAQQWTYNTTNNHFSSTVTKACRAHGASGQCKQCFDVINGHGVDLWDCKKRGDAQGENQVFTYDSVVKHIVSKENGQCVGALGPPPPPPPPGSGAEAHQYGEHVAFLSNFQETAFMSVVYKGHAYTLPNHTVIVANTTTGEVLFNTSDIDDTVATEHLETGRSFASDWSCYQEVGGTGTQKHASSSGPPEQLLYTDNDSDYAWYVTNMPSLSGESGDAKVEVKTMGGAIAYAYVDGKPLKETSRLRQAPAEDRQSADPTALSTYTFAVPEAGASSLQVLSAAMGLSNGGVGPNSVKGVAKVTVNGRDVSANPFELRWNLTGEAKHIFTEKGASNVDWVPYHGASMSGETLLWLAAKLDRPQATPNASFALDLSSMNKGVAYFNGFMLGRYWMTPGQCSGTCAPPHHGSHCYMHYKDCGKPTQTLYHIPSYLVKPTGNYVVLFEETVGVQATPRDPSKVSVVALDNHPVHDRR